MGALVLIIVGVVFAVWMSFGGEAEVHDKFNSAGLLGGKIVVFFLAQGIIILTLRLLYLAKDKTTKWKVTIGVTGVICLTILFFMQGFIRDTYVDAAKDAEKITLELKKIGER